MSMTKIFLFMEDAGELAGFEALLRKIGFDVVATARESQITEKLSGFFPEIAAIHRRGTAGESVRLAAKMRKLGYQGPIALFWPSGVDAPEVDFARAGIDATIAYPVDPPMALREFAILLGKDPQALLGKFERLRTGASGPATVDINQSVWVNGSIGERLAPDSHLHVKPTAASSAARNDRNASFLQKIANEPAEGVIARSVLNEATRRLREASVGEAQEQAARDAQKREFAAALLSAAAAMRTERSKG